MIGGIPLRMTRKPSPWYFADMKAQHKESEREFTRRYKEEREDYAKRRAKAANDAIELYADMLEISVNEAKARIAAQRQHILANPLRDLSWEYDL